MPITLLYKFITSINIGKLTHGRHWISKYSNEQVYVQSSFIEQQKINEYITNLLMLEKHIFDQISQAQLMKQYYLESMFC